MKQTNHLDCKMKVRIVSQHWHQFLTFKSLSRQYLAAFKLGGQSPVEWASCPAAGVQLMSVEHHVAFLLVNSRY